MQILIELEASDPPSGTVERADPEPDSAVPTTRFDGWLGLLRALSDLVEREEQ